MMFSSSTTGVGITVIPLLLLVGGCTAHSERSCDVHIVLPNNYRGVFLIEYAHRDGIDVVDSGRELVFRIPETGVILVRDEKWADMLISFRGSFLDGTPVPVVASGDNIPDDRLGIWVLCCTDDKKLVFFVGTPVERQQCRQDGRGSYKLGRVQE